MSIEHSVVINTCDEINEFNIHDGVITYFQFSEKHALLRINKNDVFTTIELNDVYDFAIDTFVPNMIVSEILIWPVDDAPIGSSSESNFGFSHFNNIRGGPAEINVFQHNLSKRYMDAHFFQIVCTYGGSMSFICGDAAMASPH